MNYYTHSDECVCARQGEKKRFENDKSFRFERENDFLCVCALFIRHMILKSSNGKGKRRICKEGSHISGICIHVLFHLTHTAVYTVHTFIETPCIHKVQMATREKYI